MGNSYFRFKTFRISQALNAQKVSETACIQGAWTPIPEACHEILDMGSGTGLLALMIATRKRDARITMLEVNPLNFQEGKENVLNSDYASSFNPVLADVRVFQPENRFDLIITNPPFFEGQLLSPNPHYNQARHSSDLSLNELFSSIAFLLQPDGLCSVLFPADRETELLTCAALHALYPEQILYVHHSSRHVARVIVVLFKTQINETKQRHFFIREGTAYSEEMKMLMQPYYLSL